MSHVLTQKQMSLAELQHKVQGLRRRVDNLEKFVSVMVEEVAMR